ncbi:MAG: arginase family protein [Candidatus Aenigmarchaeota archaeon]|nr:arginase family protein [Candidatus Aenigmarchaeota archaeon]
MLYTTNTFVPYNHSIEEADVVFLGVPFSSTSVSETSQYGPLIVRESLRLIEDWDGKNNVFQKICDAGDLEVVPGSYELTAERLRDTIKDIRATNPNAFLIFVGGEHLISLPIVEELRPKTIVQLDAHADLRPEFLGLKHSHVTWAYHASNISRIIQLGVRSWSKEDDLSRAEQVKDITTIQKLNGPIHLTVDMDVFDPPYVKTGLPEPGGLRPEQVFAIIDSICKYNIGNIKSVDIVEIADRSLPSNTGFLAAQIIKRVLSKRKE